MRVEVRCCCVPVKLLGWMEVTVGPEEVRPGFTYLFRVEGSDEVVALTTERWAEMQLLDSGYKPSFDALIASGEVTEVDLGFGQKGYARRRTGVAINSNERPVEFFRKLAAFVENKEGGERETAA